MSGKDKGHKTLGKDAAAWQLAQLLFCLALGVVSMLSGISVGHTLHSRAIAAAFGVVYALQVRLAQIGTSQQASSLLLCCAFRQLLLLLSQLQSLLVSRTLLHGLAFLLPVFSKCVDATG